MSSACAGLQALIVAGGQGTRLAEETQLRPKPMVEIGGQPILWHIMKSYASFGVSEFVLCLGYKGYMIKEYFANQYLHTSDVTVDTATGDLEYHGGNRESWKVTMVDTGEHTMTGGRIKRAGKYLKPDQPFFCTYGDGLSDIDFSAQISFHKEHGRLATVASVAPPGRFGALELAGEQVVAFSEKPVGDGGRINGGFFVLETGVLDYIDGDTTPFEEAPLRDLAAAGQLRAFAHDGYWKSMDALRDKMNLEKAWEDGAPWKRWES